MSAPVRFLSRSMLSAVAAASLLGGCAAFQGSRKIDVSPFSENTVGMLGEMQKFNRPVNWLYLRKYQFLPSVNAVREGLKPLRDLLRGIGLYSTQVVALYDSPLAEDRKISELARYMDDYIRPSLARADTEEIGFSTTDLDAVTKSIRSSKTFLAALGTAQPLVNAAVSRGNVLFDNVEQGAQVAAADINARVEEEFAPLNRNVAQLESLHLASVHGYTLIERYRDGEAGALDSLRDQDPAVAAFLPAKPGPKDLDAAEGFAISRSNNLQALRSQLDAQAEAYRSSLNELEDLRNQTDERSKLGRMTLLLWGRSHRNLAAGISVKPMIDVMGIMKSTASTATKGLVP